MIEKFKRNHFHIYTFRGKYDITYFFFIISILITKYAIAQEEDSLISYYRYYQEIFQSQVRE